MSRHLVAISKNGKEIYASLVQSAVSQRIARNPHLLTLVKEVVTSMDATGPAMNIERDMKRTIGYAELLETKDGDAVFYARQMRSDAYTRFVKNRKTNATSFLTILLQRDAKGNYEIEDVWIGKMFPPPPGEEGATDLSQDYWAEHAFVFNGQPIIASTVTKECPY